MFKQLINTLTGSLTQTSFSSPGVNGINLPPGAVAKNFFGNILSSVGAQQGFYGAPGSPQAGIGGIGLNQGFNQQGFNQQGFGGGIQNFGAINAFRNAQGGGNKKGQRALAPGSFVNNFGNTSLDNSRQQIINPGLGANQFGGVPLQGFAGQNGLGSPGGQLGGVPLGGFQGAPLGGFQGAPGIQQANSGGGFLPLLVMPFIGLITVIGSLFKLKRFTNSFAPVEIDKNTGYNQYQSYIDEVYASQGGFDVEPEFEMQREDFTNLDFEQQVQNF